MRFHDIAPFALSSFAVYVSAFAIEKRAALDSCPGYAATNVQQSSGGLTADLNLGGAACNVYGTDLTNLKLLVEYQTGMLYFNLLHVVSFVLMKRYIQTHDSTSRSTTQTKSFTKCPHPSCLVRLLLMETHRLALLSLCLNSYRSPFRSP